MSDSQTEAVLRWLTEAMKILDEDPSPENVQALIAQMLTNSEVIKNAIFDALRPELRDIAEAVSGLLAIGV